MKKLSFFLIAILTTFSTTSFAAGYHYLGDVQINVAGTFMGGYMNVRYNAGAAGSPYIYGAGGTNGALQFGGRDINNRGFGCFVSTSNPFHSAALDIKNSLRNGSYLVVTKNAESTECTSVFLQNASFMMD